MAGEPTVELRITTNADAVAQSLQTLSRAVAKVKKAVAGFDLSTVARSLSAVKKATEGLDFSGVVQGLRDINKAMGKAVKKETLTNLQRLSDILHQFAKNPEGYTPAAKNAVNASDSKKVVDEVVENAKNSMQEVASGANGLDRVAGRISDNVDRVSESVENLADTNNRVAGRIVDDTEAVRNAASGIRSFGSASADNSEIVERLKQGFAELGYSIRKIPVNMLRSINGSIHSLTSGPTILGRMTSAIKGFVSSALRIAKVRFIRYVLKQFVSGIKEGLENMQAYSKHIGSSFAPAMESASNAMLKMKNSLGAALAPVIEALIPILQRVVSWIITAVNYFNQFIALLSGRNHWTMATDITDVGNAASGTHKKINELLADFDELNIIQSESDGGSGKQDKPYVDMFTEVFEFDEKLKGLVTWIKDHFDLIKDVAVGIGLAILGWDVSKGFAAILGRFAGLIAMEAVTVGLTVYLSYQFSKEYLDTGEPGFLLTEILTGALGAVIASKIAKMMLGGDAGVYAAGITLTFAAVASIIPFFKKGEGFTREGIIQTLVSGAEFGTGIALLGKGLFGLKGLEILGAGASAAAIFIGVTVGVQAILEAANGKGDLEKELPKVGISAASVGLGVGLGEYVYSHSAIAALAAGGGAALATGIVLLAAIGIAASLRIEKEQLHWGYIHMDEKEVQAWVQTNMFSVDVVQTINVIGTTLNTTKSAGEALATSVSQLIPDVQLVRLGLATKETYDSILDSIYGPSRDGSGGIIAEVKAYCQAKKTELATGFSLVPLYNDDGEDISKEYIREGRTGWAGVEQWFNEQGRLIGQAIKTGTVAGMEGTRDEIIAKLTEDMSAATQAITQAQIGSTALTGLITDIGSFDNATASQIVSSFSTYKNQLVTEYTNMYRELASSYRQLEAFYKETEGVDSENAIKYGILAQGIEHELKLGLEGAIGTAVDKAVAPGREILDEGLSRIFEGNSHWGNGLKHALMNPWTEGVLKGLSPDALVKGLLDPYLKAILNEDDYKVISEALKNGLIGYGDILGSSAFGDLQAFLQDIGVWNQQYADILANTIFGSKSDSDALDKPNEKAAEFTGSIDTLVKGALTGEEQLSDMFTTISETFGGNLDTLTETVAEDATKITEDIGEITNDVPSVDTSGFENSMTNLADTTVREMDRATESMGNFIYTAGMIGGISYWGRGRGYNGYYNKPIYVKASGGLVGTGDMFIARESGPEMVGRIGNRTAVANNDQIVSGVASGVAAGQSEQNALLRQQNEYLLQLLNKKSDVVVHPSSAWGRFNEQSGSMYRRATGVAR